MELLLIRHALPERREGTQGPADPGLAPEGVRQAAELATSLAIEPLVAVVTSSLQRARQTAAPLAEAHDLSLDVREELAEFDRDSSWYVPMEELRAAGDDRWTAIVEGRWKEVFGVDIEVFQRDAVAALESVVTDHPGGSVAVVTHGGVINAYVAHVVESAKRGIFEPHYTSVSRVLAARSGVRTMRSLNEVHHLHSPASSSS